jgi:hypothetical protein
LKKGFNVHESPSEYVDFIPWLRARVVRYEIPWNAVERNGKLEEPGSTADWHYRTVLNQGAVPLIILGYPCPEEYKMYPGEWSSPPKDLAAWGRYCRWMAERYPQARGFEVWNEPNQPMFWGNRNPAPYHYAQMLATAYSNIKAVSSKPVFGGVTASIDPRAQPEPQFVEDWRFVKRMFEAGGRCDVVAFHAYESLPQYLGDRVDRFRKITKKPLSCTEFGWTTAQFSEQQQADYIRDGLKVLDSKNVQDGIV